MHQLSPQLLEPFFHTYDAPHDRALVPVPAKRRVTGSGRRPHRLPPRRAQLARRPAPESVLFISGSATATACPGWLRRRNGIAICVPGAQSAAAEPATVWTASGAVGLLVTAPRPWRCRQTAGGTARCCIGRGTITVTPRVAQGGSLLGCIGQVLGLQSSDRRLYIMKQRRRAGERRDCG